MKKISVLIIIILMYSTKSKSQNEITDFLIGSTATFQNDTEHRKMTQHRSSEQIFSAV